MLFLLFSHSVVSDPVTSWTEAHQASLTITLSQSLLKLMSIELVMPFNHLETLFIYLSILYTSSINSMSVTHQVLCW